MASKQYSKRVGTISLFWAWLIQYLKQATSEQTSRKDTKALAVVQGLL